MSASAALPAAPGVHTQFDPDHKSYTRLEESSEHAHQDATAKYASKDVKDLSELSSSLSASSSLSGSSRRPNFHDQSSSLGLASHTGSNEDGNENQFDGGSSITEYSASLSASTKPDPEMLALSPTGSRESSELSEQASSTSTTSSQAKHKNPKTFKHFTKPKVTASPRLVYLAEKFIRDNNITGLALIARRRGLPPKLRQYAWPLLLASHPYVQSPNLEGHPYAPMPTSREMQVPIKKIEKEVQRFLQKRDRTQHSASTTSTTVSSSANSIKSGQSTTDKHRQEVLHALNEKRGKAVVAAIAAFLEKYGHIIPYERIMVDLAFALADWVDPVCRLEDLATLYDGTSTCTPDVSSIQSEDATTPSATTNSGGVNESLATNFSFQSLSFTLPYSFTTVFEHLMHVVFHAPKDKRKFGNTAGVATNRISYLLTGLRQMLPELADHFDEEDICVSSASMDSGDEWLVWWNNWLGVRGWDRTDRARVWDIYFGWRPSSSDVLVDMESKTNVGNGHQKQQSQTFYSMPYDSHDFEISDNVLSLDMDELEQELGPDPFWSPNVVDDDDDDSAHTSVRIPSSPLIDHIFICIAILKSRARLLLELDQSEIRSALGRLDQCKNIENVIVEAGECWRNWTHNEQVENQE